MRGAVLPASGRSRVPRRWRECRRIRGGVAAISVEVSPRAARDTPSPRSGGAGESISHAFPSFAMPAVSRYGASTPSRRDALAHPLLRARPCNFLPCARIRFRNAGCARSEHMNQCAPGTGDSAGFQPASLALRAAQRAFAASLEGGRDAGEFRRAQQRGVARRTLSALSADDRARLAAWVSLLLA